MFVLVVDDDEVSREMLALLVSSEGHDVELAASGEEAVAKLENISPHLILTDIQMPGTAGDELARSLRAAMPKAALLMAMSGSRPSSETLRSYDGFLLKPFSMKELHAKVVELQTEIHGADLNISSSLNYKREDPTSELPVLNEDVYAKLSETMPATQISQMFSMCLADARVRIGLMAELAEAGDLVKYRAAAHAIKGGAGFIGATELYCLAEQAEHEGLSPDSGLKIGTAHVPTTVEQLSSACDRLERILDERARD